MKSLFFACPGIPLSASPRDILHGVSRVRELGLDAMELEWVRNIHVSKERAPEVKALAEKRDVKLTAHGQYWVNLCSFDKSKLRDSVNRMVDAARRAVDCNVWSITWHFGFYQGRPKEQIFDIIKSGIKEVVERIDNKNLWLRPETTGKQAQWGDLGECIGLSEEFEQVLPCIDFSHLHARSGGKENSYDEFCKTLSLIEARLGRFALENMHAHVSGIEYGLRGERNHVDLEDSDMNYRDLLRALKDFGCAGVVTAESPNVEGDALLLQKTYKQF